jgi:hypothetical protein
LALSPRPQGLRWPMRTKKGPYSVPEGPREARRTKKCLIAVLKKGRKKEKQRVLGGLEGALPQIQKS